MSNQRVRVGVVGAGGIARSVHLPSLSEMEDVQIAAICDLRADRAAEMAKTFKIPRTYLSYHEMLSTEKLDAVFVLVEPANLFHVTWAALDAGKAVFMEKPPGVTSMQAWGLARKSAQAGRPLQVGLNRRWVPAVRKALALVRERCAVNQVEGTFFKYGDAGFDNGGVAAFVADTIHALDLVRWIAGGTPVAASLVVARIDDVVDNSWNGIIRFDNGVTGVIKANYRTGGRVHRVDIHGSGASAYVDLGFGDPGASATVLTHQGAIRYSVAAAGVADEQVMSIDGLELAGSKAFHRYYGFYQEDRHFIDCVQGKSLPEPDITEAAKSLDLVEMLLANRI